MDDTRTMHAMGIDDAYHVEQVLARGPRGVTELVTIDGVGPATSLTIIGSISITCTASM